MATIDGWTGRVPVGGRGPDPGDPHLCRPEEEEEAGGQVEGPVQLNIYVFF